MGKTYYFIGRLGLPGQIKRKRSLRSTADYKPCSNYMSGTYTCVYKSLHFKKKRHDPISLEVLGGEIPLLKASFRGIAVFFGGDRHGQVIRGIECVKQKTGRLFLNWVLRFVWWLRIFSHHSPCHLTILGNVEICRKKGCEGRSFPKAEGGIFSGHCRVESSQAKEREHLRKKTYLRLPS